MIVDNLHIDPRNKWCLIIEGVEDGKRKRIYCAIPPTTGNRVDIITEFILEKGYRYNCKGLIFINIEKGKITEIKLDGKNCLKP